jgi:tetratricopeptide (TPR) repeat protein
LQHLISGRDVSPWILRAISNPGPALAFAAGLLALAGCSAWPLLRKPAGSKDSPGLAVAAASFITLLVVSGFFMAAPLTGTPQSRAAEMVNAGFAAQQAGRHVDAQESYALALTLEPSNQLALFNMATLYGKAPAATVCATSEECYARGRTAWDAGRKADALREWEAALLRFPNEAWLIRNVALCRYELGDFEGSARDYRRASELVPGDINIRTDLAWALFQLEQLDEVRSIVSHVLAVDPENVAARSIRERLQ